MVVNSYIYRSIVRIAVNFQDSNLNNVDPTTVKFMYLKPSLASAGTITILEFPTDSAIVRDSLGNFHIDLDVDEEGIWHYRWEGIGSNQIADEQQLEVKQSSFV